MQADILEKKEDHFVLWRVANSHPPPALIIGRLIPGTPITFQLHQEIALLPDPGHGDLWMVAAADCGLTDGITYHYWFEVTDAHPDRSHKRIRITDPLAGMVDWRLQAEKPAGQEYHSDDEYPPAVILFRQGKLLVSDAAGETINIASVQDVTTLPANNQLVLYELPTAWSKLGSAGEREIGVGSFQDVQSLLTPEQEGANFEDVAVTHGAYLVELGINALELLPPADSFYQRQWGYGTTNFLAPDFELGYPRQYDWPVPNRDLSQLVEICHRQGIRFFIDVVMAFARTNAYLAAATNDFFILNPAADQADPDAFNSRQGNSRTLRNGFGSSLFRYASFSEGYDPVSGKKRFINPARQLMITAMLRWMKDFQVDGLRLDSVENIANWDFVQAFKQKARDAWKARFPQQPDEADARFLVVGEELQEPMELLQQQRLDGLWREQFKKYIRAALLGKNAGDEPSFEWTVRKAIDCRYTGYQDGTQAIIYLTSHDVEGPQNERLFNFLQNNGIVHKQRRIQLGFVCLLTAVGIPMILAGEEFADEHDLFDQQGHVTQGGGKQVDPVNFSRLEDEWRAAIKNYVARLVRFRTTHPALAVNDTQFIHVDFNDGKRVLVWQRGRPDHDDPVVVVANFSDFAQDTGLHSTQEYIIPNWPATPIGRRWIEITTSAEVPAERVGREPITDWTAKVYTLA